MLGTEASKLRDSLSLSKAWLVVSERAKGLGFRVEGFGGRSTGAWIVGREFLSGVFQELLEGLH